jgi:DNA replication and repair protein RecF
MKFEDVSVEYKSGLGVGEKKAYNYLDILQQKRSVDIRAGHTTAGPHRADLIVKVNGVIASNLLSRGQLRLLISSLKLAQNKHLAKESGKMCVVLIDDLAAELDQKSSYSFFSELLKTNCQLFITSIERNQLPKIPVEVEQKLFHVKHGYITTEEK